MARTTVCRARVLVVTLEPPSLLPPKARLSDESTLEKRSLVAFKLALDDAKSVVELPTEDLRVVEEVSVAGGPLWFSSVSTDDIRLPSRPSLVSPFSSSMVIL